MRKLEWILIGVLVGTLAFVLLNRDGNWPAKLDELDNIISKQRSTIAKLNVAYDSLTRAQRKIDTIYVQQQIAYARTDSAYKAAPTQTVHDTVWVPKAQADADIKGCQVLLLTCDQRAALAESRAHNRDSVATLAEDNSRRAQAVADGVTVQARKQKWTWGLIGFGAGSLSCNALPLFLPHR